MFASRIRELPRVFVAIVLLAMAAGTAAAQNPTGTITGRVLDSGGLPAAGATVTARSPGLQGSRTTTASENGDYRLPLLPPGEYTLTFELNSFSPQTKAATVAAGEPVVVDATLQPAGVSENITVQANADSFARTIENATSIKHQLLDSLPTARTILSAANLSPSVNATGPDGHLVISGAMSFESLYLVNGVQIQDNLRREPFALFIEDAIQETTISTSGISAEYGRFTGGIVNAITRSGSNRFDGSFRVTFTNDDWRTVTPLDEPKTDDVVPTFEYTAGGPVVKDRTWFFFAGRNFDRSQAEQTGYTNIPFVAGLNEKRFEGKVTQSFGAAQRFTGSYMNIQTEDRNSAFPEPAGVMDTRTLITRQLPQELLSLNYGGVIGSNLFVEAQFSQRQFTFENSGGRTTDLIEGTQILDQQTGALWWAPAFCGVCGPEERDNRSLLLKGSYFLSTPNGSHNFVFGYDTFNDIRRANNHQTASDYRIYATASVMDGDSVVPVLLPDFATWIVWFPISQASQGTDFRSHSLFVNDTWRAGDRVTISAGLRYDKNDGKDAVGQLVAKDSAWSPRLGVSFDPTGDGDWTLNAGYGKYVAAIANNIADLSSPAGTPSVYAYYYLGPPINLEAPLVSTDQALRQMFDWFFANGGTDRTPWLTQLPGVNTQIRGSLASPHASEYTVGVSRRLGSRGILRADVVRRDFRDFYAARTDTSTGRVTNEIGQAFDLTLIENTNALTRNYTALALQGSYRLNDRVTAGGNYTLSKLYGNVNGENINSGPLTSSILQNPEYFERAWSFPEGDLAGDQRHRVRAWASVDLPVPSRFGRLSVGLLEQIQSGTPYGAVGAVQTQPFVPGPIYLEPPASVPYFFTARDAFRTDAMLRTDLSLNYAHRLPGAARGELFVNVHVLNLFNQFQVFDNSGNAINTTVLTVIDDPSRFQAFNPFTTTPVQGTHWDVGEQFGEPIAAGAYTLPRTFRFSVGVRF
jgi:outer membrane receptor protein involved in Fe transport